MINYDSITDFNILNNLYKEINKSFSDLNKKGLYNNFNWKKCRKLNEKWKKTILLFSIFRMKEELFF
mgnify:CR=1